MAPGVESGIVGVESVPRVVENTPKVRKVVDMMLAIKDEPSVPAAAAPVTPAAALLPTASGQPAPVTPVQAPVCAPIAVAKAPQERHGLGCAFQDETGWHEAWHSP